jgi:hypothetical protein
MLALMGAPLHPILFWQMTGLGGVLLLIGVILLRWL